MPSVEMIGDLDDYNETSTISFSQAEETTYSYSASKEAGKGLDVELALKFGFKSETQVGPAVVAATLSSIEESKVLVGFRGKFEAMWSWSEEASFGTTRETGRTTSLELRGRYTTPEENENEQINPAPSAETRHAGRIISGRGGRRWRVFHFPRDTRLAKSRYAPGTPCGNWRKNASPV